MFQLVGVSSAPFRVTSSIPRTLSNLLFVLGAEVGKIWKLWLWFREINRRANCLFHSYCFKKSEGLQMHDNLNSIIYLNSGDWSINVTLLVTTLRDRLIVGESFAKWSVLFSKAFFCQTIFSNFFSVMFFLGGGG